MIEVGISIAIDYIFYIFRLALVWLAETVVWLLFPHLPVSSLVHLTISAWVLFLKPTSTLLDPVSYHCLDIYTKQYYEQKHMTKSYSRIPIFRLWCIHWRRWSISNGLRRSCHVPISSRMHRILPKRCCCNRKSH